MDLLDIFDHYSRQARLQPALFALFPLLVTIAVWVPTLYSVAAGLVGLAVACGTVVYLAHLSRTFGRRAEVRLFSSWGGKPTSLWLRHGGDNLDPRTRARYHEFLTNRVPDWQAPTPEDEARDHAAADAAYDSAVRWLREWTRDRKRFALVFKENVSYGFRRNLYGLKPIGILICVGCVIGNLGALYEATYLSGQPTSAAGVASLVLSFAALVGWVVVVGQRWVRDGADGYARALLAACDAQ